MEKVPSDPSPVDSPAVATDRSEAPRVDSHPSLRLSLRRSPRSAPAFYARRKKRGDEICQILLRDGAVTAEDVRRALRIQEERGGQVGRILVKLGACTERQVSRALKQQVRLAHERGKPVRVSALAREHPDVAGLDVQCRPKTTVAILVLADVAVLAVVGALAAGIDYLHAQTITRNLLHYGIPTLVLLPVIFAPLGLYAPTAPSPPDEIRRTTLAATAVFIGVASVAMFGLTWIPWRIDAILALEWLACVVSIPFARAFVRGAFSKRAWWGVPVVVLGAGRTGRDLVRALQHRPDVGLRPVMILDDDIRKHGTLRATISDHDIEVHSLRNVALPSLRDLDAVAAPSSRRLEVSLAAPPTLRNPSAPSPPPPAPPADEPPPSSDPTSSSPDSQRPRGHFAEVEGVPVIGGVELAPLLAERLGIKYAIVAMPGVSARKLVQITEKVGGAFSHLLLIPDLFGFASLGAPSREVGGVLGIEVRQQLLLPGPRLAKRMLDVSLVLLGGVVVFPIILLLALLVKLDSKGPVFYPQRRLGRDGRRFTALKFRSMHGDGEARLAQVLAKSAKLRAEYAEFHKLSFDPRVTRIGRVLRKYSLDELPQLLNVLWGDMSLVGPRPYLERELADMNGQEGLILRALPGLTGMWQVSDRNATGFAERVKLDVHYVRNWSPWVDIYVLARTLRVVLRGTGA
jgi:lipopolysaccharide/colanic/teichoic acid biosynthesis glycosyltransferase